MITIMDSIREPIRKPEGCLDPQLWHACAGGMVQMPPVSSSAFYFPQGHAEHATGGVDFGNVPIPPLIPCRVSAIKYLADRETDEVYAKIRLVPQKENEFSYKDDTLSGSNGSENTERAASFAKTLTQSDANNGGGFSVPRYCAETIFPRLDYSAEPPVQTILVKDVHGEVWKFRHIYRGTPRRHLLTTGWSNFVNQKKLVAGDSIVFLRAENGDLCVGIRRAKRGMGGGQEYPSGWNTGTGNSGSIFGGYSPFVKDDDCKLTRKSSAGDLRGRLRPESVVEAAILAARGHPFEVIYYPRASTPEFVVKASAVRAAMQIQWCSGMRFKMPFETEDSSRISWFMGTISSVQVTDPIRWPNSPWRLLQVTWDEPELLQNVKHVNPWLVEIVSNIPTIHLSPFSPQRKKMRLPQPPDVSLLNQLPVPSFSTSSLLSPSSPLCCITENVPAGIQGARHAQFGSPSDVHFGKLQSYPFPGGFQPHEHAAKACGIPGNSFSRYDENNENVSCLLTVGNPSKGFDRKIETKAPHILLFGQVILTEQQASGSFSADTTGHSSSDGNTEKAAISSDLSGFTLHQNGPQENSSDEGSPRCINNQESGLGFEGHCKVFMESDDVGRTVDLSLLRSYEELYDKLADMYGLENGEMLSNVLYHDAAGSVKHTGDMPFSEFLNTVRRLMILADSGSQNVGR